MGVVRMRRKAQQRKKTMFELISGRCWSFYKEKYKVL